MYEKWLKEVNKEVLESPTITTPSPITIKPIYFRDDIKGDDGIDSELPGHYPFTRGPYATMYAERSWTIRQVPVGSTSSHHC